MSARVYDHTRKPLIVVNFKAAQEGSGKNAVYLARHLERFMPFIPEYDVILAVPVVDIYRITQETSLKVFAQHVDPVHYGSFTGCICPFAVKESGATGTLLNHIERPLPHPVIEQTVQLSKEAGLVTIICASTIDEGKAVSKYDPDYIGMESTYVGGVDTASMLPYAEVVEKSVTRIDTRILFGGGISTRQDVQQIVDKGASGIMISSAVVKSSEPGRALVELFGRNVDAYLSQVS